MMRKANFFIVGEPRSATTALYYFLEQHPDVYMPGYKEPHYFCKDFHKESFAFHGKRAKAFYPFTTRKEYEALYDGWKDERLAGEASANYLPSKVAAKEIAKYNKDAKIIMIFRNPVEFLHSFHSRMELFGETEKDFEKALLLESRRKKGIDVPKKIRLPSSLYYSERAKYVTHLKRFLKYFPKEQILIILFDDFQKSNKKVYQTVCEFLGLDKTILPDFSRINENLVTKGKFSRWLLQNPFVLGTFKNIVPLKSYNRLRKTFFPYIVKKEKRMPITQQAKKRVQKMTFQEVKQLSKIMGRDILTLWGYK